MTIPEDTRARRQLAAILSADAVGYSRRMAEDEAATVAAMRSHRETLGGFVREHHGRVVNAVGDNMLAEFASAVDAAACAVAVQAELARREAHLPADRRLQFRIGSPSRRPRDRRRRNLRRRDQHRGTARGPRRARRRLCIVGGRRAGARQGRRGHRGHRRAGAQEHPGPDPRLSRLRALVAGEQATANGTTVPGFGGRPAIAILPFEQRGGDATTRFSPTVSSRS